MSTKEEKKILKSFHVDWKDGFDRVELKVGTKKLKTYGEQRRR